MVDAKLSDAEHVRPQQLFLLRLHFRSYLRLRPEKLIGIIGLLQVNPGSANAMGELFPHLFGVLPVHG